MLCLEVSAPPPHFPSDVHSHWQDKRISAILHLAAAVMAATEKEFGECGISLVRQV
jgi:hypothetical protein